MIRTRDVFAFAALVALGGCSAPDEPIAPTDSISGELTAWFSVLNAEVTDDLWALYGSDIVVVALADPDDLSSAVGWAIQTAPGAFTLPLDAGAGPVWLAGIVDNGDRVLSDSDLLWEYAGNPVGAGATGLDLAVQLPMLQGDDDEEDEPPAYALEGTYTGAEPARLLVTMTWQQQTFSVASADVAPGDAFSLDLPDGPEMTLLLVADSDGDGFFGGRDRGGVAATFQAPTSDVLDLGDVDLPEGMAAPGVQPPPWVEVTGTVSGADGPITVEARRFTSTGTLWSRVELDADGAFLLRAPTSSVAGVAGRDQDRQLWLHAFVDADGDGTLDRTEETQAGAGPITIDEEGLDVALQLGPPGPAIWGGIGGTITWDGTPAADEHLLVAVFLEDVTWEGMCEYVQVYSDPVFPFTFDFPSLPGDRYQVGAMLTRGEAIIQPMQATALGMRDEVIALTPGAVLLADFELVTGAEPPVDNGGG